MEHKKHETRTMELLKSAALPIVVVIVNLSIIIFPKQSIDAASRGAALWFENVLPVMLPFMICCNLLMSLGIVGFISALLNRVMRPLFGVPGCGAFALFAGLFSGYPLGASITADLRMRGEITKREGEHLITFVNNAGPLFVLGAVGASMFGSVEIGYMLMACNAVAAILTGILFGLARNKKRDEEPTDAYQKKPIVAFFESSRLDPRPFGAKLSDAALKSIIAVAQIGAFIMLFSVIVGVFQQLNLFNMSDNIMKGLAVGSLEMTNGAKILAEGGASFGTVVAVSAVIGWGSLSVAAQTLAILSKTDINVGYYFVGKLLNGIFAALLTAICCIAFNDLFFTEGVSAAYSTTLAGRWLDSLRYIGLAAVVFAILIVVCYIIGLTNRRSSVKMSSKKPLHFSPSVARGSVGKSSVGRGSFSKSSVGRSSVGKRAFGRKSFGRSSFTRSLLAGRSPRSKEL